MIHHRRAAAFLFVALAFFCHNGSYAARKGATAPPAPLPDPFLSYIVRVKSLQLINTLGEKVEVAPVPISIDFAQVVNLDAAVNEGLIPQGDYVAATMVLDFSRFEITTAGANGTIVSLLPYDSSANLLTGLKTVSLQLQGYAHFVVSPRTAALQALDPRLAASSTVNVANRSVTVGDVWSAAVIPSGNTWVRLAGALTTVYSTVPEYTLTVSGRKVYNTVATGDVKLAVTPTTTYTIAGRAYTGSAGESVMAGYPKGTSVTATGSLQPGGKTLIASVVVVN